MRDLACVSRCAFSSLSDVMSEHFHILLVAMALGAFFGATFGGIMETLIGAGIGLLLAVVYGYVPRMTDCVGSCPIQ